LLLSSAIALVAWRRGSLSRSGAVTALGIGTACYLGGGVVFFAALLVFFATSTLLGKVGQARKEQTKREFSKSDTRDAWQALSNGGVAAACALLHAAWPSPLWTAAFFGALAAANADTWATELGILSRGEPLSLLSLRRVPRGTSGAVSSLGMLATIAGALTVGLVSAALHGSALVVAATLAGIFGSLADSVLGASVQAGYFCPQCQYEIESPVHHCGSTSSLRRGVAWFGNDAVNLSATACGAASSVLFYLAL
jgi:uncharacterized protein (TIGR00297 family)